MDCKTSSHNENENEKALLERKHKRVLKLREEYWKQVSNPCRHATGEGGTIFDSGIQRFMSMRSNQYDYFKPTKRVFRIGAIGVVIPIVLFAWTVNRERYKREQLYRTGQVAYKDRKFKFI